MKEENKKKKNNKNMFYGLTLKAKQIQFLKNFYSKRCASVHLAFWTVVFSLVEILK